MATVRLSKHHGLGNDFLVCADPSVPVDEGLARAACARTTGIGADGFLWVGPGDAELGTDLTMTLANADGSRAEMSGNGIRCFVQAAIRAGRVNGPVAHVGTDAGVRTVQVISGDGVRAMVRVEMGPVRITGDAPEWVTGGVERASTAQVGNPHLVLLAPHGADVAALGAKANSQFADGINVEVIAVEPDGSLDLTVFERGVGVTQACGTGATAAAAVAHAWELAPARTTVRMPGGQVEVELDGTAHLTGPTVFVGDIDYLWPHG